MLAQAAALKTPACEAPKTQDLVGIQHAIFQAKLGLSEGGIPIGAALVNSEGVVLGVGRNRRVQLGSATRHGETDCLEIVGGSFFPCTEIISLKTFRTFSVFLRQFTKAARCTRL